MARRNKNERTKRLRARDLTDVQVRKIRARYAKGDVSHKELAAEYNVAPHVIGRIARGEIRSEAGGPITRQRPPLDDATVAKIRSRYAKGEKSQAELAEEYGISLSAACRLVRGDTYADADGPIWREQGRPRGLKLTAEQKNHVLTSEESANSLAKLYGVSRQAISQLRRAHEERQAKARRRRGMR